MVRWFWRPPPLALRPSTITPLGGPRFVAAVRKARLWFVPLVSTGLGPDESGPFQCWPSILPIHHSAFIIRHCLGGTLAPRPSTAAPLGGPRFVAAVRKACLWFVPLVSNGLGPDEAGPSQCGPSTSSFSISCPFPPPACPPSFPLVTCHSSLVPARPLPRFPHSSLVTCHSSLRGASRRASPLRPALHLRASARPSFHSSLFTFHCAALPRPPLPRATPRNPPTAPRHNRSGLSRSASSAPHVRTAIPARCQVRRPATSRRHVQCRTP